MSGLGFAPWEFKLAQTSNSHVAREKIPSLAAEWVVQKRKEIDLYLKRRY